MLIKLDLKKTLEQNAEVYFLKAKKARQKLEGAKIALEKTKKKLEKEKEKTEEVKKKEEKIIRKKEWYEKFRWFISSEGFLCIGGRDATTNEIIVKKHTDKEDIIFHTAMAGSPFFVVKGGIKAGEETIKETAQATATYSKAWKAQMSYAEVFWVLPNQVTKEAKAGEYVPKGGFMIYGKKNILQAKTGLAIGILKGQIIGGPVNAIKKNAEKFVIISQGSHKASDIAKKIIKKFKEGEIDEIIKFLPAGKYSMT